MNDIRQSRPAKLEYLQKIGMLRFVLAGGIFCAVPLGVLVFITSPPTPWYIAAMLVYVGGTVVAAAGWFFWTWFYSRALK